MSEEIRTHREIWGTDFPLGGEWDAGLAPFHWPPDRRGRWTVRRTETGFEVFFRSFILQRDEVLATFPPTEEGERQAKAFALAKVREAWGEG